MEEIERLEKLAEELEEQGFQFNMDEITKQEELALYVIHKLFKTESSFRKWITTVVRAYCKAFTVSEQRRSKAEKIMALLAMWTEEE